MPIDTLHRAGILGIVLDALNVGNTSVVLTNDGVSLHGRIPVTLKFGDLATELSVRKRLGFRFSRWPGSMDQTSA